MDAAQVGCCLYEAGPGTSLTISLLQQRWSGLPGVNIVPAMSVRYARPTGSTRNEASLNNACTVRRPLDRGDGLPDLSRHLTRLFAHGALLCAAASAST